MNNTDLQWITYLSLTALAIVSYLFIRQRNENNQRNQSYLRQEEYYQPNSKPPGFMTRSFPGSGSNLPTFAPQEAFQRKLPSEIGPNNITPKNLRSFSGFVDGNVSHFDVSSRDIDQTKNPDKSFEDFRKYKPYEPSHEASSFISTSKLDQNDGNRPHWSKIEASITQVSTQQDGYDQPNNDVRYIETQKQMSQEVPITEDRWDNVRNLDTRPLNTYSELENEYKVFKDFKLREGRSFHDEPKKDESPHRPTKRISGLDRVGHSPDSPFKMFESPAIGTNSKKKLGANQADASKPTKLQQALISKRDSFARTQEALNQKSKPPVRPVPHNQRSAQVLANQRNERKARLNQVFIDNNSEDEMQVEEQKDPSTKNKRAAADTRSYDNFEREANNKKFVKGNDQQPKLKIGEVKRPSYEPEGPSKKGHKSLNKQSSVDLSYMTEYSRNPSLKKYVQMKTRQDETTKPNKPSTPASNTKAMSVEKSPNQGVSSKVQDKANAGPFRPPSSLAKKEEPAVTAKKATSNGHSAVGEKEPKTLGLGTQNGDKTLEKKSEDNKFGNLSKDTNVKPEGAKISSILGGSSLFSQPKPAEPQTSTAAEDVKLPKPAEAEKTQAPSGQQGGMNLFKTIRAGGPLTTNEEPKDQPEKIVGEEKNKEAEEPKKQPTLGLFANLAENKKAEGEKPQDQSSKPEVKSLFSGNSGLFGNLNSTNQNTASTDSKQEGLKLGQTENKPESSSGLGFLFKGTANNETKDTAVKTSPPSQGLGLTAKGNDTNGKVEEKPKVGLFGALLNQTAGQSSLFGASALEAKKESALGLFANANKNAESGEAKKEDPLAAYSKPPEPADDTKPKSLFANNTNSSFSSLFKNSGSAGSSGLFAGLQANKDGQSTGGLFANLKNTNQAKEQTE